MKRNTYYQGVPGVKYGIWNAQRKCWQFGICSEYGEEEPKWND